MQTAREQVYYPLPDDLDRITQLVIHGPEEWVAHHSIWLISPEEMMQCRAQRPGVLGKPTVAAVVMNDGKPALIFYPDPDDAYTIDAVYQSHLKKL